MKLSNRTIIALAVAIVVLVVLPALFAAGVVVALLVLVISPLLLVALVLVARNRPANRRTYRP